MNIKITLDKHYGRLSQREPFSLAKDEDVTLNFEADYLLANAIVNLSNGAERAQVRLTSNSLIVPKNVAKGGTLNIVVHLCSNGRVVYSFIVEPIVLCEISTGFEGHPEFEEIKASVESLCETVQEMSKAVAKIDECIARIADLEAKNEE